MRHSKLIHMLLFLSFLSSCGDDEAINGNGNIGAQEWTIPFSEVRDGGPGKDGIPALLNPATVSFGSAGLEYLDNADLVMVYKNGGDVVIYPHKILDWHEIINDDVNDESFAVTYCPLTGTGFGWDRNINGRNTTFGVSGLLYNTNLIPFDRLTDSFWSQMEFECVSGELIRSQPGFVELVQMTYQASIEMFPSAKVVTQNTGWNRNYLRYPYGDYMTSSSLIFPVNNRSNLFHEKDNVLGLQVGNNTKVYHNSLFETPSAYNDEIDDQQYIIIGDNSKGYMVAYKNMQIDNQWLEMTVSDENEYIMTDQFGNQWNVFGEQVSGPNSGLSLESTQSYIGFWFAWFAFNPDLTVFEE